MIEPMKRETRRLRAGLRLLKKLSKSTRRELADDLWNIRAECGRKWLAESIKLLRFGPPFKQNNL